MTRLAASRPLLASFCAGLLWLTGCDGGASAPAATRYELYPVQTAGGPAALRFDTADGAVALAPLAGSRVFTPVGAPRREPGAKARSGRYRLEVARAPSIPLTFLCVDTQTGEAWRLAHGRDRDWVSFREPGVPAPAREEAPPPRPRKAGPADSAPAAAPAPADLAAIEREYRPFIEAIGSARLPANMRIWAVQQLGNAPTQFAVPHLLEVLADADTGVVRMAILALAKHEDPRVEPAIEQLTHDEREEVRRVATTTLRKLRASRSTS